MVTLLAVGALVALSTVFLACTRHYCVLPFDSWCDGLAMGRLNPSRSGPR